MLHLIQGWRCSCESSQRNQFPDSWFSLGSLDGGCSMLLCARDLLQGRGRSQFQEQPVMERDGGGSSGQPPKHGVPFPLLVCPWVSQISGSPSHHQIPRTASVGNGAVNEGTRWVFKRNQQLRPEAVPEESHSLGQDGCVSRKESSGAGEPLHL